MKKLFAPALLIAGLVFGTNTSFANEFVSDNSGNHDGDSGKGKASAFYKRNKEEIRNFKAVVSTFFTSNGEFLNLSSEDQNTFINSAETLKTKLAKRNDEKAKELLKKVDLTENVFRFVWNSKPEYVEMDFGFEAPELPSNADIIL